MNTSSVDCGEELRAKCIQSVTNQNAEPDDNCSESEDNEEDAMEIDSKPAVNSGETFVTLDKLQVLFEENDAENEVLWSVTSWTKKVEKMRIESKKQKISLIFSSNFFCSYGCNLKRKYCKRKIDHLKVFAFIFYLQGVSFLFPVLAKIEIRLRYRKISTMLFLSIKKSLLYTPE